MQQSQARKQKTVVDLSVSTRSTSLTRSIQRSPPSKKPAQRIDPMDFPPMSQSDNSAPSAQVWTGAPASHADDDSNSSDSSV